MELTYFHWADYLVFAVVLVLSAGIGFYYACTGDKQRTTKEYLQADKNMHWFPVGCSLIASFTSSQTLIGLPGEIYTFGTIYLFAFIAKPLAVIIGVLFFLPVLRGLQAISVYKYIELRFGKRIKYMLVAAGLVRTLFFGALVVYGPALSLSAVTGLNIWIAVLSVLLVAMLYTILGGLKAVLWTDTLQLIIMLLGVLSVLIYGIYTEGGFGEVWEANRLSGRLDILEANKVFEMDPRARHTFWSVTINGLQTFAVVYGMTQVSVMRAMSLRSNKDTVLAYTMASVGIGAFGIMCGLLGLVVFSHNKLCDPVSEGVIHSKDQLYPLYVMKLMGHLPGLPGFILSAIFSASLSSISSFLNSNTAIILQEFIRPCRPNMSDKTATFVSKIISLGLGSIFFAVVLFARFFGNGLLSMGMTFAGIFGGPTFGVFVAGMFLPIVNERSITIGYLAGAAFAGWFGFGTLINKPYIYKYPTTTDGCNMTDINILTNMSSPIYDPSTWHPHSHYRSGVEAMYDISYLYTGTFGVVISIIVSLIASICLPKKDDPLIESRLVSPWILKSCCLMPRRWKERVSQENKETNNLELSEVESDKSSNIDEKMET